MGEHHDDVFLGSREAIATCHCCHTPHSYHPQRCTDCNSRTQNPQQFEGSLSSLSHSQLSDLITSPHISSWKVAVMILTDKDNQDGK